MGSFLEEIEAFMAAHGMSESKFGQDALGDHKFVGQVRSGRSPSLKTAERVRRFMLAYPCHERDAA